MCWRCSPIGAASCHRWAVVTFEMCDARPCSSSCFFLQWDLPATSLQTQAPCMFVL